MNRHEVIQKCAAGLRKMDTKPVCFLFMDFHVSSKWVWDEENICGIPVIFSNNVVHVSDDRECPFLPCFNAQKDHTMQVEYFRRGYEEY